nr:probable 3',5'-cyclic phosphodiesterase pde-5 [Helicoverpa armigera]
MSAARAALDTAQSPSSRHSQSSKARSPEARSPHLLPPIYNGTSTSSAGHKLPVCPPAQDGGWSRFHSDCRQKHSMYLDWTAVRTDTKTGNTPRREKAKSMTSFKDAEEQEVAEYLENNKDFLEAYILERVPAEVLEKLLHKKLKKTSVKPLTPNHTPVMHCRKPDTCKKEMFTDLVRVVQEQPSEHAVLWRLAQHMSRALGADAYRLYKLYPDHTTFVQFFVQSQDDVRSLVRAYTEQVRLVLEVAKAGTCRRVSRAENPRIFPQTPVALFRSLGKNVKQANHVMYQPILTKTGKTAYVLEMWRVKDRFKDVDEEISSNFLVLGSVALHYCNLYLDKKRERNMSDFLLDVVKAIFEEMDSLEKLIKRILQFAQRLVRADRASLFLVDYRNSELVSTVFDLKYEPGQDRDMEKKEIRMPINRGIAGHVALSGKTMNIPDAYSDHRFNKEVDEATGYKTTSILCMPIKVRGRVIGVVQMVNKRNGDPFDREDEEYFELFSTFFGLSLHQAMLYDTIRMKEQKYRVALEVLSYHNTCRDNEVLAMLADKEPISINLNDYYLNPYKLSEFEKCKSVIKMFSDLFGLANFDIVTLTRFVLTVKKNYRTVPYHNFDHGWTVAHTMHVILENDEQKRFNCKMRLALFVACLCHDLDHRGYTNTKLELAMAISMTAADLSASAKPWCIQIKTVNVIFEEFYDQGDKERAAGREPIPMMDRNKPEEQPSSQVGFLSQICIPCYSMLCHILPHTRPMYVMALINLDRWKNRADNINKPTLEFSPIMTDFENSENTRAGHKNEEKIKPETTREGIKPKLKIRSELSPVTEVVHDSLIWEDDDDAEVALTEGNQLHAGGIWKDIDGDDWIDEWINEEGVVVQGRDVKSIVDKDNRKKDDTAMEVTSKPSVVRQLFS